MVCVIVDFPIRSGEICPFVRAIPPKAWLNTVALQQQQQPNDMNQVCLICLTGMFDFMQYASYGGSTHLP